MTNTRNGWNNVEHRTCPWNKHVPGTGKVDVTSHNATILNNCIKKNLPPLLIPGAEGCKRSIDVAVTLQFQNVIDGTTCLGRYVKTFKRTWPSPFTDYKNKQCLSPHGYAVFRPVYSWKCDHPKTRSSCNAIISEHLHPEMRSPAFIRKCVHRHFFYHWFESAIPWHPDKSCYPYRGVRYTNHIRLSITWYLNNNSIRLPIDF